MIRKALAVVGGFIVWSILWLAANAGLGAAGVLPPTGKPETDPVPLLLLLAASVVASLCAGISASLLGRASGREAALWLGAVLLVVGAFVQAQYWHLMPVWYHATFLLLLIPACLIGSRLSPNNSPKLTPPRSAA